MDKNELKPCPFCGGEAEIFQVGQKGITVKCTKCHVTRKQKVLRYTVEWLREKAIEWWNTRINLSSTQPVEDEGNMWVKVEDKLPPYTDKFYYWLYSESIDNCEQGEYNHDFGFFTDKAGVRLYHVSHWKIPQPPKTFKNG